MRNYNFSVVIPAYNEQEYLSRCLESISKLDPKPVEVLVIDNNSTDETAKIASSHGAKVIKEETQGMIYARNRGFDEAKGEIIARTDSDTEVPTDWLEKIAKNFEDPDVVAVSGPSRYGKNLSPFWTESLFSLNKTILKHPVLYGPNMALRKKTWLEVKDEVCMSDADVHEDMDLSIHLSKYGKIVFDPEIIVHTSDRRMKNDPKSLFIDYVIKWGRTIKRHSDTLS